MFLRCLTILYPGTFSGTKVITYSEMASINVSYFLLLPGALTQAIRNFAKSLESWLTNAMMNIPEEMVRIKVHSPCADLLLVEQQFF